MKFKALETYYRLLACLLLAVVTGGGCKRSADGSSSDGYFHTHFQTEGQFIVETIVTDIAEQVYFAKRHQLPDAKHFSVDAREKPDSTPDSPFYQIKVVLDSKTPPITVELKVATPIWSEETFKDITAALAQAVGLESSVPAPTEDEVWLKNLEDGTAETIETENQDISTSLQGDFSDANLHRQAAALLCVFALRDHSQPYFDIRTPLCRATAHLAMAEYLGGDNPRGLNGDLAEAMLLTLMNNERAAIAALDRIPTANDAVACWVRVLKARNTGDYRPLSALKSRSMIETIEWFHAYTVSVNNQVAWSKVPDTAKKTYPDFCRIANDAGYTVETAHDLMDLSVGMEMREIASVYQASRGQALKPAELITALNQMPERCFSKREKGGEEVKVIGWGQWALFLQRHLCSALMHDYDSLENKWGLPEDAKKFADASQKSFGGMRFYPLVSRRTCSDSAEFHKSVDDGLKLTVATPHLVPDECWNYLCYLGPD